MKSKGLTTLIAFVLAATATLAVYLYVSGLEEDEETSVGNVQVLVTSQDITAGTNLDELISTGALTTRLVNADDVVPGAVTSLSEVEGKRTTAAILEGEQITTARLEGGRLPGGTLGIPEGYQGLTLPLESFRLVGGAVTEGDNVTIYGTFKQRDGEVTVTMVPQAEILKYRSAAQEGATTGAAGDSITMALKPKHAQEVVFGIEVGTVYMSLIPPDQTGKQIAPTSLAKVIR